MLTSALMGSTASGLSATMLQASAQSRSLTGSGASTLLMVVCASGGIASTSQRYQRRNGPRMVGVHVGAQLDDLEFKLTNSPFKAELVLKLTNAPLKLAGLGANFLSERLDELQRLAPRDVRPVAHLWRWLDGRSRSLDSFIDK